MIWFVRVSERFGLEVVCFLGERRGSERGDMVCKGFGEDRVRVGMFFG